MDKIQIFTAPTPVIYRTDVEAIFLAGTIDQGESIDWQMYTIGWFIGRDKEVTIVNPRRTNWNNNLPQVPENKEFSEQVNWELDNLEKVDTIIMCFLPHSKSPVTLLEMGLCIRSSRLLISCPDEFWRSGNVRIVAERYGVTVYKSLEELLKANYPR